MTDQTIGSTINGITAGGLGAVIPTALLVALLNRQSALPSDPVAVDARSLEVAVPPEAIADLLRTLYPERSVTVVFATASLTVSVSGMPSVRIEIPAEGMRIHVDERGLRLGGR